MTLAKLPPLFRRNISAERCCVISCRGTTIPGSAHPEMDALKELTTPEASDFITGNAAKLAGKAAKAAIGAAGAAGAWLWNKMRKAPQPPEDPPSTGTRLL